MGLPKLRELESRFLSAEDRKRKYGKVAQYRKMAPFGQSRTG